MNKTCAAFWKHFNLRSNDEIYPCCRFKRKIGTFDGDLEKVLLSKEFEDLRHKSSSGVAIPECAKCFYEEDNGIKSIRQQINERYNADKVGLEYLEISFDNICNLTCDGCSELWSTEWAKKKNPNAKKKNYLRSTTEISRVPDSIKEILFMGGEPLMTNRHYKLLCKVKNPAAVSLTYNTNGTFLLKDQHIDLLKQFKNVKFLISIDGIGVLNEKVRHGSKWNDVMKFIDQVKANEFDYIIHSVLHKNNWHGFPDIVDWVEQNRHPWRFNILTWPTSLDVKSLDGDTKSKIEQVIRNSNLDSVKRDYIINHLQ